MNAFPHRWWSVLGAVAVAALLVAALLYLVPVAPARTVCFSAVGHPAGRVVASLPVGDWPQGVLYDPADNELYVSAEYSQNVSIFNATCFDRIATLSTHQDARAMALDPANGRLFVSDDWSSNLTVIDTANDSIAATVGLAGFGYMVGDQYDPGTGQLFVLANNNPALLDVSPSTYGILQTTYLAPNPGGGNGFAINPSSHVIYFPARGYDSLQLVGELNGTVFGSIALPGPFGPTATFFDPVNGLIYVMLGGLLDDPGAQMVVLNATTDTVIATLTLGGWPDDYVYNPATQLLYVSCAAGGDIAVVNADTNTLVTTYSLGAGSLPGTVSLDASTGALFVGEDGEGAVALVSVAPSA